MTISGTNTIKIADVLVGDVWVGSGQSNMQWAVRQSDNADSRNRRGEIPADSILLRSAQALARAGRRRGREVGGVLAGVGEGLLGGAVLLRPPDAPGSQGADGIDPHVVGRHADRVVDQRTVARRPTPRLEPFLTYWQNVILQYPINASRHEQALKKWEASGSQGARPAAPMGPGHAHEPTSLYNGMIAPLVKYTIKGALWYQGETEAGRAQGHVYGEAMMTLVQDWRRAFGQGDFPFYWVQLANYGNAAKNGHWMKVQEGQVKATALRNTGVAIINDIGNPTDIHPTNKQDVGWRLAMLAQNRDASPLYRQFTREGSAIRIWFDNAGKALKTRGNGPLTGFQIAGADGKYVAATARIEGTTVLVSSPEVTNPWSVRYAWDYNPDGNLINAAGLPASLFRTDENDDRVR